MKNLIHSKPKKIILIGASTGGPGEISKILESLKVLNNTSIIIAQHMMVGFMKSFAMNLNSPSVDSMHLIENNDLLENEKIYIAQGYTEIKIKYSRWVFESFPSDSENFNPDINKLFNSFMALLQEVDILCIILTGIGEDGVEACVNIQNNKGECLTQTKDAAIVDGMPSRARELVPNIKIKDMKDIIDFIKNFSK